ncbi:hypothetical protein BTM330_15640 [Helicobacter pylori]
MNSWEFHTIATFFGNVSAVTEFRFDAPRAFCLNYLPSSDASSTAEKAPIV